MAPPVARFTAAIPTPMAPKAISTTLVLKIVVGRLGQATCRISEMDSRTKSRTLDRLITTGLRWLHDGCPAHPVVVGAGGLGGRGGVRAPAGSGSTTLVSHSALSLATGLILHTLAGAGVGHGPGVRGHPAR